jgi:hypothetical protein
LVNLPGNYAHRKLGPNSFVLVEKAEVWPTGGGREFISRERPVAIFPSELRKPVEELAAYDAITRSPDVSDDSRKAARYRVAQIFCKHNPRLRPAKGV